MGRRHAEDRRHRKPDRSRHGIGCPRADSDPDPRCRRLEQHPDRLLDEGRRGDAVRREEGQRSLPWLPSRPMLHAAGILRCGLSMILSQGDFSARAWTSSRDPSIERPFDDDDVEEISGIRSCARSRRGIRRCSPAHRASAPPRTRPAARRGDLSPTFSGPTTLRTVRPRIRRSRGEALVPQVEELVLELLHGIRIGRPVGVLDLWPSR